MLLSICDFLQPEQQGEGLPGLVQSAFTSFTFGPAVGNSWRTDTDVGLPGKVSFGGVLRNLDADAADPQAAGPGHWNDPDYLAPQQGMSATQFRTQLSMWAMLAAPLMVSADLTKINSTSVSYLENEELLAVDQDPAGVQGTLVAAAGNGEVWVKPLADGSRAVAFLNRGTSATRIATTASAVGMSGSAAYVWRDLWSHHNLAGGSAVSATVPGGGTVLLRVSVK
jgi:alpha-galactosidase